MSGPVAVWYDEDGRKGISHVLKKKTFFYF